MTEILAPTVGGILLGYYIDGFRGGVIVGALTVALASWVSWKDRKQAKKDADAELRRLISDILNKKGSP